MEFGALIANWNGAGVIDRCVGSALAAAHHLGRPIKIMVVDDAGTDDSADTVERLFPSVELLRLHVNIGFGQAVNAGMKAIGTPWVFLLNNDLALPPDYFTRLVEARDSVENFNLFAIGAKTLEWETNAPNHAGMNASWSGGMIVQEPFDGAELARTDFIQGGACLVDREKFLELGGFCPIYHPGYWEDYDIAYQALKRGWVNYYEPRAAAHHWGKRSMSALLGRRGLNLTIKRNEILFNWLNLTDAPLIARNLVGMGGRVMRDGQSTRQTLTENPARWSDAVKAAVQRLPEALAIRRARAQQAAVVSDRQILERRKAAQRR